VKRSSNRNVATRLRALFLTLGLVLVGVVGVASPASASGAPVQLAGSQWLGDDGVNVCDASTETTCGGETHVGGVSSNWWQCVELAQRLYDARGWHAGIFASVGVAHDIYDNAASNGFTRQADGSVTSVVPGDMLVFSGGGGPGHVGIISTVIDNGNGTKTLAVVNQNAYEVTSNVTWNTSTKTVGKYSYMDGHSTDTTFTVMGVVHDPDNTNTVGGGTLAARAGIRNGGFNNGTSYWTRTGSANMVAYGPSGVYEGDGYGATNAAAAGDSIRQDVALNTTAGHSYCVNAQLRTMGGGSGGSGSLVIWLLGSTASENSSKAFSNLPGDWTPMDACVTATSSHTTLRVQIYPTAGGPTLGVDALDFRESLINNAGFNGSSSGWSRTGTANFALYGSGSYEGTGYGATNATASGDSIRQDVTRTINSGDSYCVEAQVRSDYTGATSSGSLAIWLLGTSATENSTFQFSNIGNDWTPIKTCVAATSAHTSVRVQFYPTPGAPTIGVDAVSLHYMLSRNGGFNNGTWLWSATGTANFTTYGPSGSYEGSGYGATNATASGDSIRQDVTRAIDTDDMYCVSARVRTMGGGSGGSGSLALWMLGTSATENSVIPFSSLTSDWTPIKTCVTATGAHTSLRMQLYSTPGGPTIGVDAVDLG